jgi:hypothetical protein
MGPNLMVDALLDFNLEALASSLAPRSPYSNVQLRICWTAVKLPVPAVNPT